MNTKNRVQIYQRTWVATNEIHQVLSECEVAMHCADWKETKRLFLKLADMCDAASLIPELHK